MTTSSEIRRAVVRAFYGQGLSYEEISNLLAIGEATVSRVLRLYRETGSVEPKPRGGGHYSPIRAEVAENLVHLIEEHPDTSTPELTDLLTRAGVRTSRSAVKRALRRLGYSKKRKSFVAEERDRPNVVERRRAYGAFVRRIEPERLVFLDESYCTTSMVRAEAWAPLGSRAVGKRPFRSWKTVSLIGAIRLGARPKLMTSPGSVNGKRFLEYVKERLCPWLRPGDVVVMDNFSTHKMKSVRDAIGAVDAHVYFLPPYSPDLNPIELWWADAKRLFRTIAARTESELRAAARQIRASLPIRKIKQWFQHSLRTCLGNVPRTR